MSGNAKKFEATFENGGFWEYYKDLERQFENFLEYVPYLDGNEETYSFRLANLILAIGAHIDSAFKEIATYTEFASKYQILFKKVSKGKPTIVDYVDLAVEYKLPHKKVEFKCLPERVEIIPFKDYEKVGNLFKTPSWWKVYNGIKHKFKKNLEKANLKNTRDSLAAAFLLNVVHKPSAIRLYDYDVLKIRIPFQSAPGRYTTVGTTRSQFIKTVEAGLKFTGDVETSLFKYDYYQ